MFAQPLVGYSTESARRALPKCENKREIKGQIRVVLRLVSFVLFSVKKRNLEDKASPTTNDSQDNSVTKQPCFGEQPTVVLSLITKKLSAITCQYLAAPFQLQHSSTVSHYPSNTGNQPPTTT